MNRFRGILLLAAGSFALYHGWRVHSARQALWAYGLGVLAIALGIWRLTRPRTNADILSPRRD
jgi:uncharacterized membrane protein HdeD (DUF308 family)